MKGRNFYKILIPLFVIVFATTCFADDYMDNKYFNSLVPTDFIYHYNDRKDSLPQDRINYDDIADYVHYYNPEVLSNWNDWENNKSANDVYEDYIDAADKLYDAAGSQEQELQEGMLYAQADAMLIQADKSVNDSYTNFLTYYLKEKQLVLATKLLDINYQKSIYEHLSAKLSYEEALRKEESANNALKYGSGTDVELLAAKKSVADANSNIIKADSASKAHKRNLLTNCGKAYDDNILISPIDLEVDIDLAEFDIEKDYELALKNNVQYEIYKRRMNNARTSEVKKEYEILVNAAVQNIYNDLELKYSNIVDLVDTRYNREVAYKLALDSYKKAENEYHNGSISEKAFKTSEYNMNVAKYNLDVIKYDYKIAVENYRAVVDGYGNC